MLKRQKPYNLALYTAIEPSKVTELHLAGFYPEYLWGRYVYFKTTDELISYLNGEPNTKKQEKKNIKEEKPKESKIDSTKASYSKKSSKDEIAK